MFFTDKLFFSSCEPSTQKLLWERSWGLRNEPRDPNTGAMKESIPLKPHRAIRMWLSQDLGVYPQVNFKCQFTNTSVFSHPVINGYRVSKTVWRRSKKNIFAFQ